MIILGIGRMEIDWGKNNYYRDHSALFQLTDIKEIPYYYVDMDSHKLVIEKKEGYSRKLSLIKRRLDLLGYDLKSLSILYEKAVIQYSEFDCEILLSFNDYCRAIKSIELSQVDTVKIAIESHQYGYDFGEYVRRCILDDPHIKKNLLTLNEKDDPDSWQDPTSNFAEFLENLDPYIMLRILADNPNNSNYELQWGFADVIDNGWVKRCEIVRELTPDEKILIVTEGSSDSFILRKTLDSLYPDISDFFDFVDMEKNYPFTGVGNLYNFCLGLIRINIQNNILVLFDNDTAGVEKYELVASVNRPVNLLITKLPDSFDFSLFSTIGPQGQTVEDINGKAVAIECFLDLNSVNDAPSVRWTSYSKKKRQYQGELERKDEYVRKFKAASLLSDYYNVRKLTYLLDHLIVQWVERNN